MAAAVKIGRHGDMLQLHYLVWEKKIASLTAVTFIADLNSRTKERD